MTESFWGGFVSGVVCVLLLIGIIALAASPSTEQVNSVNAVCRVQLHAATPSDSLRIYRLQPKCLP